MIPHPDGLELCHQFRRDGWNGPIVAISALTSPELRERALSAGADRFLAKPFRLGELVATLEHIYLRASARRERDPPALIGSPPDSLPTSMAQNGHRVDGGSRP
jgi:DNA-binding response OmpR family regulator